MSARSTLWKERCCLCHNDIANSRRAGQDVYLWLRCTVIIWNQEVHTVRKQHRNLSAHVGMCQLHLHSVRVPESGRPDFPWHRPRLYLACLALCSSLRKNCLHPAFPLTPQRHYQSNDHQGYVCLGHTQTHRTFVCFVCFWNNTNKLSVMRTVCCLSDTRKKLNSGFL